MYGDKRLIVVYLFVILIFLIIKKGYELIIKKDKTTNIVLSMQILIGLLVLYKFKLSIFTIILLLSLVFMSHSVITDLSKLEIPYVSIIGLFILGLIGLFFNNEYPFNVSLNDKLAGFIIFIILWISISLIQYKLNKEFIGGGDLMLFCVISLLIGWQYTMLGIFYASVIALIVEKIKKNKSLFPFGPYLIIGFIISILTSDYLMKLIKG